MRQQEKKRASGSLPSRPVTRRVRQVVRRLYQLRSLRSIHLTRRAIFLTLCLFGVVTMLSMVATQRLFRTQQEIKQAQQEIILSGKSTSALAHRIALGEASAGHDADIVQATFYVQSALTVGLLFLCYLYFLGDRADRHRQERRLRSANRRLSRLVEADGLTELKNRRAFEEKLLEEWERAKRYEMPLSLILLDVDHFKRYNDSYGHLAGDQALKMTADILRRQARRNDFPARYGGEEFAVVLPHTGASAAIVAAERIRAAFLAAPWPERPVTVSIGVATLHREIEDRAQFVNEADLALYYAKHMGRNRVVHIRDVVVAV